MQLRFWRAVAAGLMVLAASAVARAEQRLVIEHAKWDGEGGQVWDVTDKVRALEINGDSLDFLANVEHLGDPSPRRYKRLTLTVLARGQRLVLTYDNGNWVNVKVGETVTGNIDVTVPCAKPEGQPSGAALDMPADPNQIARTEYANKPKALLRSLTSVKGMMVRINDDGAMVGLARDIIAAVPAASRQGDKAGIGIIRDDGDQEMKVALEEAVRAIQLRYPTWQPGHIDISFGDKFDTHGGASIGTAFGLLMLSTLEGFEIDPNVAVTGDITVDWKVRKVGGVTAKLRGAEAAGCKVALIPTANAQTFGDLRLLYNTAALYDTQVFTVDTLQQVVGLARKDRASDLQQAIDAFAGLQAKLHADEASTLRDPETEKTLEHVLELAPNHLSAQALLAVVQHKEEKALSLQGSLHELALVMAPYVPLVTDLRKVDRSTLPPVVTATSRRRLGELRPLMDPDVLPLLTDVSALVDALDGYAARRVPERTVDAKWNALLARETMLAGDEHFFEKVLRETY